ncbi:hypothetical protein SLS62_006625 [Diatrype stigma]|uniref:Uncharacterized protein n=1 Tax=Diatrype stigma TaxID=117547 RepID=A0AAN9YRG1_9PEZI
MNTVGLFTTFAPFPPTMASGLGRRCAIVAREKRLLVVDLDEDDENGATAHDIQRDVPGYRVLSLMIPQRSSHGHRSDDNNNNDKDHPHNHETEGFITSGSDDNNNYSSHNHSSNKIYALAAPNASHRVMLLEMRVPLPPAPSSYPTTYGRGNLTRSSGPSSSSGSPSPRRSNDGNSSGEVDVLEIAQLEGLSYDDEFTERLCEGDSDGDGGGGGGYVLVAALVGANRKAIYRVPLALPAGVGEDEGLADGRVYPAVRDWSSTVLYLGTR